MKKYFAEFLGTFVLTLTVVLSINGNFPVATPILAALALGLLVYAVGHISGTHINPAVTIGLWSIGKISVKDAGAYIISQFIGAGLAMIVARIFVEPFPLDVVNSLNVGLAEMIGMLFFGFGIASVVYGKAPAVFSGVVVGGSLLLGISLASAASNGVLNPAVAFGIGSLNLMYILGPIVGAVLGMQVYKLLNSD